ncbi:TetR/AcrR family transcriptional regulator [Actinophytocola gossypii]|uniref:TetR/AcrR family transcriptional regulator n=1 Tax=Actinophytocola gossypii TaxID=2812003 RepID=A0ABT2J9D0_9PSEU|nr:TetR/AcrR family transcriptional regulator [Actinophytocola gossypii]MCT2584477.1 TetR/AcrR family transcriptional regulator [Actinophytocola gossypii]
MQPDPEDLTARARIRDAALRLFGEQGFDRATIRGIAEVAGVSSGLVRHHFGSKEALRDECDAYLARALTRLNDQVRADMATSETNYLAVAVSVFAPYRSYISRALVEGRVAPLFDTLADLSAEWLAERDENRADPPEVPLKARAAVGTAMSLAVSVLYEHVSRRLGVDVFSAEGQVLLARTLLDLYSHPWLSPEEAAALRARLPEDSGSDTAEGGA